MLIIIMLNSVANCNVVRVVCESVRRSSRSGNGRSFFSSDYEVGKLLVCGSQLEPSFVSRNIQTSSSL